MPINFLGADNRGLKISGKSRDLKKTQLKDGSIETSIAITNSLQSLSQFFGDENIDFWLEAGSALAAYRDGKVFEWEHDIDIAIWRDDLRDVSRLRSFFQSKGYIVIIQKNLLSSTI